MKSTWHERHTVRRRSYRGIAARDLANLGAPILVRNPRAIATIGAWLFGFACCVACIASFGVEAALRSRTLGDLGASIFFLGISLALLYEFVRVIFSREQVRLDSRSLAYTWVDGFVRKQRVIPLSEIRSIMPYSVMVNGGENQPSHPEYGLVIETVGQPLRVGQGRDQDETNRLQEWIERHLQEWDPNWANAPDCDHCEVMDGSSTRPEAPSDSTILCRREWDQTEFIKRRPTNYWFAVLPRLPLVLSVSAMIGTIILNPSEPGPDAFHWLFRILVGSAGLFLLVPWVSLMVRRRRWVVRPGEIRTSVPMLGLAWQRTTEIEWLARIELRRLWRTSKPWFADRIGFGSPAPGFELALVDLDEYDVAIFGPLTEGEARWMAGIIAEVLKDALPKNGQSFDRWSVSVNAPANGSQAMGDPYLDEPIIASDSSGSSEVTKVTGPREISRHEDVGPIQKVSA